MKFTNGYWRMREEIKPLWATEYEDSIVHGNDLTVYATTKHVADRADVVNMSLLTITLTSPMENVIKVSLVHFKGAPFKGPFFDIAATQNHKVTITEDDKIISYKTGSLQAIINKGANAWKITYMDGDKILTETSYRNMSYMKNSVTSRNYMVEQLAMDVGESIYGLGERYTPFVKNGQTVEMWNEDGGTATEQTYKNIPFYISNKGYGILVDNPGDVHFEIASEKVERSQFSVEGERLDYYIISGGTPKKTVQMYTDLTGKPALPPAWTFGLWLTTSFTTSYDEETVTSFIQGMQDRDIPLHTFHFDCFWMKGNEWCNFEWDSDTFPDPDGMLKRYKDRGLKICCWINPYIAQKSKLFDEGVNGNYFVKTTENYVWQWDLWQSGMALVDFTNPDACVWFQNKLQPLLDMGVDCFKTDFGERIPVKGIKYFDDSDPVKMHNFYTYLYNKTVFEVIEKKYGKNKATVFARSTTVGGQKFPVHWGGDCSASYASMAEELRGGLSLSLSGYGFWSHDISGFELTAPIDVYKRWCAFGLLTSHSRLHGSKSYRVPWLFDEEACDVLRYFVKLKCSFMPYLYGQAVLSHKTGIPMHRAMFLEFPDDPTCESLDRQYMWGDSLLVAPIFKDNGEVTYYLPKGTWTNYITGNIIVGGKWLKESYDYFSLPLMVRPNTVLAVGACNNKPDYDYADGVTLKLFQIEDGANIVSEIPDLNGELSLSAVTERSGNRITVTVNGNTNNWNVLLMNQNDFRITREVNVVTITLV